MKPTLRALPDTIVKKGSSAGVGKLAKSYGAKGVFLVTDATMVKIGKKKKPGDSTGRGPNPARHRDSCEPPREQEP